MLLWALVPATSLGLFFYSLIHERMGMQVGTGLLAAAAVIIYAWVFRRGETRICLEAAVLLMLLAVFPLIYVDYILIYVEDLYDLFGLPVDGQLDLYYGGDLAVNMIYAAVFAYLGVIGARSAFATVSQRRFRENSLCVRAAAFLGRGRSIRGKMGGEVLGALAVSWVLAVPLIVLFAHPYSSPILQYILLPAILIVQAGLLCVMLLGKRSAAADMEAVAELVEESAEGHFPEENPLPAKSVFAQTGEAAVRLGKLTEEGIEKGIAGERLKVELITNVSHDLRTPLTSVIGYAEELAGRNLGAEEQEMAERILARSRYLGALVEDLFDLSKAASGNAELIRGEFSLNRLAEQTAAEMQDKIEESGFPVIFRLAEEDTTVRSDGMRLHRVLQNLLDNALKYSQPGTRIFLETERLPEEVRLSVINTAAYTEGLDRIDLTERFTRGDASRSTEGSGLGLAIARTYVEAVGGSFTVEIRGDQFEARILLPANERDL